MAAKKKMKKQQTKSKKTAGRKTTSTEKKTVAKGRTSKKALAKKKPTAKKPVRRKSAPVNVATFPMKAPATRSGQQSGDLQGLSNIERADSESVDELVEEGNAFEAGVVTGVEEAGTDDAREVHTHEVPEDDVPGEYLDKD